MEENLEMEPHLVSKPPEAPTEAPAAVAQTSTMVPPAEKKKKDKHKKEDTPVEKKRKDKRKKGDPLEASATVETAPATVSSAEKKKKDKEKKRVKEDEQKRDTKKREVAKNEKTKKKKKSKRENVSSSSSSNSSSSSSSSSESDEDMSNKKKGKSTEAWIWWGILGGLLLVIGGVLQMSKASKIQQVDGNRQEKRKNETGRQCPLVSDEHKERKNDHRDLPIEPWRNMENE